MSRTNDDPRGERMESPEQERMKLETLLQECAAFMVSLGQLGPRGQALLAKIREVLK